MESNIEGFFSWLKWVGSTTNEQTPEALSRYWFGCRQPIGSMMGRLFIYISYYLTMQNQRIHGSVHISSKDNMVGIQWRGGFFISYLEDGSSQLLVVSKFPRSYGDRFRSPKGSGKVPSPNGRAINGLQMGGDPNHLRTGMILQVDCGCCGCSIFPLNMLNIIIPYQLQKPVVILTTYIYKYWKAHPPSSIHVRVDSWAMKKN